MRSFSHVSCDPHVPQKPRLTPGDDLKYFGSPCLMRNALCGTEIQVVIGDDVARRQLSQWQYTVQLGSASYSKMIERQKQCPSTREPDISSPHRSHERLTKRDFRRKFLLKPRFGLSRLAKIS